MSSPAVSFPSSAPAHAEDLSRMEGEYGAKMLGKLKQMDCLVIGLKGLGVETAKNLILAGPHSVVIYDDSPAEMADLGANFYLTAEDVENKRKRSEALLGQLGELNPNVNVNLLSGRLGAAELHRFDAIAVTSDDYPLAQLVEWNKIARARQPIPAAFIVSSIAGCSGMIFSDFGADHHVFDLDGSAVRTVVVDHISRAANGVVTIDGDRHLLNDGDLIKFEEVHGMSDSLPLGGSELTFGQSDLVTDINQTHVIKTTKNPKKFLIGDTRQLGEYSGGGLGTQVKKHETLQFESLEAQLRTPTFISGYMDFTKFGRDAQLHLARLAIWQFQASHGRLPAVHSLEDARQVFDLAKSIAAAAAPNSPLQVEADETLIRQYTLYFRCELSPIAALFGGIVAQEITKQTGKYTPLGQWFHFDAFELLSDAVPSDGQPSGSRYDHQIAVFGRAFQDKMLRQKTFMVGVGALGCEFLKSFALMGLGCGGGELVITDDDRIELSNLSRQFLFRRKHVGKAKSTSAAESVARMNPAITGILKALEARVEPKTEDVFDDQFWDSRDFVVNALDNMIARKYVDAQCVLHHKALFESGTLGTQANSVVCLPFKTPSYSEGAVAGEDQGIARCTLRNFPSDITHAIEWAREKFDDLFMSGAESANSFLEDRAAFLAKLKQDPLTEADALKAVEKWLNLSAHPTFDTCVKMAIDEFLSSYRNAIKDLTHHFPKDARNIDRATGADLGPFWHGHKRFPQSAEFSIQDELHLEFVYRCSNILASVFGIGEKSLAEVKAIAQNIPIEEWKFTGSAVNLSEEKKDEKKSQDAPEEDAEVIARLTEKLISLNLSGFKKLFPADFEKDDDKNHHVDWITAATNLRAWNYFIKPATRAKCRLTAGKIIPAIATTTAAITGFIGLEIYKFIAGASLDRFRAATINLATNVFCCENLPDPKLRKSGLDPQTYMQVVAIPENHSIWDFVEIRHTDPNLTLEQFLAEFSRVHHGCVIDILSTPNGAVLFNGMDLLEEKRKAIVQQRLKQPILQIYESLVGKVFPPKRKFILFECSVEDDSGNPGIVPTLKFTFKE